MSNAAYRPISAKCVAARIAGRKLASEFHQCADVPSDLDAADCYRRAIVEELAKLFGIVEPQPTRPEAHRQSIASLGATRLNFGSHVGKTFDEAPRQYLDWLCRSSEDLLGNLRAYLTHPEIETRRRGIDG